MQSLGDTSANIMSARSSSNWSPIGSAGISRVSLLLLGALETVHQKLSGRQSQAEPTHPKIWASAVSPSTNRQGEGHPGKQQRTETRDIVWDPQVGAGGNPRGHILLGPFPPGNHPVADCHIQWRTWRTCRQGGVDTEIHWRASMHEKKSPERSR